MAATSFPAVDSAPLERLHEWRGPRSVRNMRRIASHTRSAITSPTGRAERTSETGDGSAS